MYVLDLFHRNTELSVQIWSTEIHLKVTKKVKYRNLSHVKISKRSRDLLLSAFELNNFETVKDVLTKDIALIDYIMGIPVTNPHIMDEVANHEQPQFMEHAEYLTYRYENYSPSNRSFKKMFKILHFHNDKKLRIIE